MAKHGSENAHSKKPRDTHHDGEETQSESVDEIIEGIETEVSEAGNNLPEPPVTLPEEEHDVDETEEEAVEAEQVSARNWLAFAGDLLWFIWDGIAFVIRNILILFGEVRITARSAVAWLTLVFIVFCIVAIGFYNLGKQNSEPVEVTPSAVPVETEQVSFESQMVVYTEPIPTLEVDEIRINEIYFHGGSAYNIVNDEGFFVVLNLDNSEPRILTCVSLMCRLDHIQGNKVYYKDYIFPMEAEIY